MRRQDPEVARLSNVEVAEMLENLTARANAQRLLKVVVDAHAAQRTDRKALSLPHDPLAMVTLGEALFAARRITREEFIYLLDHSAHSQNQDLWLGDAYELELQPISLKMREIEAAHGLTQDQSWAKGDAPVEHDELNRQYEAVLDRHFEKILADIGHSDVTTLYFTDGDEWRRMAEVGRRLFMHDRIPPPSPTETIKMLVKSYEAEASLCEAAGAFYAGCAMLGAAAEARLLWACLEMPEIAERCRSGLEKSKRPKGADPNKWTLEQLIAVSEAAGWLGELETDEFIFVVSGLAERLRHARNFLHAGKHAADRPLSSLAAEEFRDAKASYQGLRLVLEGAHGQAQRSAGEAQGRIDLNRRSE